MRCPRCVSRYSNCVCVCLGVCARGNLLDKRPTYTRTARYIGGQIQLSRENMISDYNWATPATLPPIFSKLLFYIYCGNVNRTHAVGARDALIIRDWCSKGGQDLHFAPSSRITLLPPAGSFLSTRISVIIRENNCRVGVEMF